MVGKLSVPGRPANLDEVGQGPIALAEGAGGGCLDIYSLIGYLHGDNHIRIGNRTELYSTVRRYFRRHFFPVPLFPETSIIWGT